MGQKYRRISDKVGGSTLHRTIYLSHRLDFRKKRFITERYIFVCIASRRFLNTNVVSSFVKEEDERKKKTFP